MTEEDTSATLSFLRAVSHSMQSWSPGLARYYAMRFHAIVMPEVGNGWKAAHHMCLSCGVQFTGSRNGSRTRTVSLKRMRKKLAYLQSKPSTSNHIVAPSLASQKQVQCFLMRRCPACSKSVLLPVAKTNVERHCTPLNKQVAFASQKQANVDKKSIKRKKRRSSIPEAILKMKGTASTGSNPSLKHFLSLLSSTDEA